MKSPGTTMKLGVKRNGLCESELLSFVDLSIVRSFLYGKKLHHRSVHSLWGKEFGRDIFRNTMSRQRFLAILKYSVHRCQRRAADKFAAIIDLWQSVIARRRDSFNQLLTSNSNLQMQRFFHTEI